MPARAACSRFAISAWASAPNRSWNPAMPSGRNSHDSVSSVPASTGANVYPPARPGAAHREGELAAPVGHDDLRTGLPGSPRQLVAPGEPGSFGRAVALVPPAGPGDRAPLAHPGHVGDHVVEELR